MEEEFKNENADPEEEPTEQQPEGKKPEAANIIPTEEPEKKYTDDDLDGILQKRLARERAKMEREIRERILTEAEDERSEAEKLKGMTELQRARYEVEKLKSQNAALERQQNLSEQMAIARKELSDAGITMGDDLLAMFVSSEAEKTNTAIEAIKTLWPAAVNAAVKDALKRTPPAAEQKKNSKSFGATFAETYSKQMNGGK